MLNVFSFGTGEFNRNSCSLRLMLERGWCDAEARRHLQSHDSTHDADERIMMHGMCHGIHGFAPDRGWGGLRTAGRIAGFACNRKRTHQENGIKTLITFAE